MTTDTFIKSASISPVEVSGSTGVVRGIHSSDPRINAALADVTYGSPADAGRAGRKAVRKYVDLLEDLADS